jgi:predicted nuclease of predicted toxin-antitoxin system
VHTVIDEGLSGATDVDVLAAAVAEDRALVTMDLDFANPIRFPPHDTAGIAIQRTRDRAGHDELEGVVGRQVIALGEADLSGHLWIVERNRVRQYEEPSDTL